jgi:hypothetical protein
MDIGRDYTKRPFQTKKRESAYEEGQIAFQLCHQTAHLLITASAEVLADESCIGVNV